MTTKLAARQHPTILRKLAQGIHLVRNSYREPITGQPQSPQLVDSEELGITFIGHSSFLIQIAGRNVLIDPVFVRALVLLRRQRRVGTLVADLPPIDLVLLTHAHMDHLNLPSLRAIIRHTREITGVAPVAIVPRGVRDLVDRLGFRSVTELEWWQSASLLPTGEIAPPQSQFSANFTPISPQEITITLTPCKHWGARMFADTHRLYGGYVIDGAGHTIYHSGDTAYFNGFHEIGRRLRPQVALLPIGAYYPDTYRAVHTTPEEALQAYRDLGTANVMIPMHFGTFALGREPLAEPPIRLTQAAQKAGLSSQIQILNEGETSVLATPVQSAI